MAVTRGIRLAAWTVAGALLVAACTSSGSSSAPPRTSGSASSASATETGIQKIKHVVIIMQENRSFDSFFGTYPGADGIPAKNGQFTVLSALGVVMVLTLVVLVTVAYKLGAKVGLKQD